MEAEYKGWGFFSKVKRQQIIIGFTLALNKLQEKEAKGLYKLLPVLIYSHIVLV